MGKMNNGTNRTLTAVAITLAISLPWAVSAGGYGSAGVKDDRVSNYATAGDQVWCSRLDRNVPQALAAEMNCRGTPTASRQRSGGLAGFFSSLRSNPNAKYPEEDHDNPPTVVSRNPRPETPSEPEPETPPTAKGPVDKWERLADFNVNPDNLQSQDRDFKNSVKDYLSSHGPKADWSDFNPD